MDKKVITTIVLVIVVSLVSFFGGMKYQQSKNAGLPGNFTRGQFDQQGQRTGNRGFQNNQSFRPVSGEIISQDDQSITVKQNDGSSLIVVISQSTEYLKSENGTKDDLKTGEKVMVVGTQNSDGSITAQNIQINPLMRNAPAGEATPSMTIQQ